MSGPGPGLTCESVDARLLSFGSIFCPGPRFILARTVAAGPICLAWTRGPVHRSGWCLIGRELDWIALWLHYVINSARRFTTINRRYDRQPGRQYGRLMTRRTG
jgi:hypothetical protein